MRICVCFQAHIGINIYITAYAHDNEGFLALDCTYYFNSKTENAWGYILNPKIFISISINYKMIGISSIYHHIQKILKERTYINFKESFS